MSTKSNVLKILEENRGILFSGQAIASQLGVSRNAVWKAIKALQSEGIKIESQGNAGYFLSTTSNKLTTEGITASLPDSLKEIPLLVFDKIGSTNEEIKKLISENSSSGMIIVSNAQTKGKGRLGRDFYSPANSGIYMSIALKPNIPLSKNSLMTTAAAVATCRAIESVSPSRAQIKWVNDIYCAGKKVSGILAEGIIKLETGELDWGIIGIGVNCFEPDDGFPNEIKETAAAIVSETGCSFNRNLLAAKIITEFFDVWTNRDSNNFMDEYKKRSLVIGKRIKVIKNPSKPNIQITATALEIGDDGSLLVEYDDKTTEVLIAGEVSLKL